MSQLKQQKVEKNFSILLGRAQIFEPYAHCEFDDIKTMKRDTFKKLVREKIRSLALKNLLNEKEKLSKMKSLQYTELKLQSYLSSGKLNTAQKKMLFKIRVRMVMTADNMGKMQLCQLCGLARDEMAHVPVCIMVKLASPDLVISGNSVNISDAYGRTGLTRRK